MMRNRPWMGLRVAVCDVRWRLAKQPPILPGLPAQRATRTILRKVREPSKGLPGPTMIQLVGQVQLPLRCRIPGEWAGNHIRSPGNQPTF